MTNHARTKAARKRSSTNEAEHSSARKQARKPGRLERVHEQHGHRSKDHALLQLQRSHGNQAVQRLVKEQIQPKLEVGHPDDKYEREADRVAEKVMRRPESAAIKEPNKDGLGTRVQRMCSRCQEQFQQGMPLNCTECEQELRRVDATRSSRVSRPRLRQSRSRGAHATNGENESRRNGRRQRVAATPGGTPPIVGDVLRSPGRPLDQPVRGFMEDRFGSDFSRVRVHTNARAAESARAVNARAYTVGDQIVFGEGQYRPGTDHGKRLLAHEITHVIQQRDGTTGKLRLMRAPIFTGTIDYICHQYLRSRTFHVSDGGLRVTIDASWGPDPRDPAPTVPVGCRPDRDFSVELREDGFILDDPYGTCDFSAGIRNSRIWTNLPEDDYYLGINTPDTGPHCCLSGTIEVSQERGLSGESCTVPPPGPLDLLHTALDLAGLVPGIGAAADLTNAGLYLIEGEWVDAGISLVGVVPIFGDSATVVRARKALSRPRRAISAKGTEIVERGARPIARDLREARTARAAAEESGQAASRRARRGDPEAPSMRRRLPGLSGCGVGSIVCPLTYLRYELDTLFDRRYNSEFIEYIHPSADEVELVIRQSLRREMTIETGNRMYAQFLSEVPRGEWSRPFREAVDLAGRPGVDHRVIIVGGRPMKWPLDDLGNPYVVHHGPPLGWTSISEGTTLWHPMPDRIHSLAHSWWTDLQREIRGRIEAAGANFRDAVRGEEQLDIREF